MPDPYEKWLKPDKAAPERRVAGDPYAKWLGGQRASPAPAAPPSTITGAENGVSAIADVDNPRLEDAPAPQPAASGPAPATQPTASAPAAPTNINQLAEVYPALSPQQIVDLRNTANVRNAYLAAGAPGVRPYEVNRPEAIQDVGPNFSGEDPAFEQYMRVKESPASVLPREAGKVTPGVVGLTSNERAGANLLAGVGKTADSFVDLANIVPSLLPKEWNQKPLPTSGAQEMLDAIREAQGQGQMLPASNWEAAKEGASGVARELLPFAPGLSSVNAPLRIAGAVEELPGFANLAKAIPGGKSALGFSAYTAASELPALARGKQSTSEYAAQTVAALPQSLLSALQGAGESGQTILGAIMRGQITPEETLRAFQSAEPAAAMSGLLLGLRGKREPASVAGVPRELVEHVGQSLGPGFAATPDENGTFTVSPKPPSGPAEGTPGPATGAQPTPAAAPRQPALTPGGAAAPTGWGAIEGGKSTEPQRAALTPAAMKNFEVARQRPGDTLIGSLDTLLDMKDKRVAKIFKDLKPQSVGVFVTDSLPPDVFAQHVTTAYGNDYVLLNGKKDVTPGDVFNSLVHEGVHALRFAKGRAMPKDAEYDKRPQELSARKATGFAMGGETQPQPTKEITNAGTKLPTGPVPAGTQGGEPHVGAGQPPGGPQAAEQPRTGQENTIAQPGHGPDQQAGGNAEPGARRLDQGQRAAPAQAQQEQRQPDRVLSRESELQALNDYLAKHDASKGTVPAREPYLSTRDEAFAAAVNKPDSRRQSDTTLFGDKKTGLESVQEAIATGERLGYRPEDIAAYLKRSYADRLAKEGASDESQKPPVSPVSPQQAATGENPVAGHRPTEVRGPDRVSEVGAQGQAGHAEGGVKSGLPRVIQDAIDKSEPARTRIVRELGAFQPQVSPAHIKAAVALMDARADTWSKQTGRPADEWWSTHIAGVQKGGQPGESALYQDQPWYFSALRKAIEQKMPNRASADQIRGILAGGNVKADEVKWTGLDDLLANAKGPLDKAEVLRHLDQNAVKVEEVAKGTGLTPEQAKEMEKVTRDADEARDRLYAEHEKITRAAGTNALPAAATLARYAEDGESWGSVWSWHGPKVAGSVPAGLDHVKEAYESLRYARERQRRLVKDSNNGTKYERFTLPGGENYRELLLTLPAKSRPIEGLSGTDPNDPRNRVAEPTFQSSHFNEPNILAHVRFNDRTDAQGKRVLFVEEVQSDWHEQGRERGYQSGADTEKLRRAVFAAQPAAIEAVKKIDNLGFVRTNDALASIAEHSDWAHRWHVEEGLTPQEIDAVDHWRAARQELIKARTSVPAAPFGKSWHELALKRVLRWAAEHGYDRVAWTTGEQQSERYDLAKHVDELHLYPYESEAEPAELAAIKDGKPVARHRVADEQELANYVGKEIASRLWNAPPDSDGARRLKNLDLKVGGSGMRGFYDKIIPDFLNRYAKKWGARVGETGIETIRGVDPDRDPELVSDAELSSVLPQSTERVHALDVTPAMRESVMQGQPLFQPGEHGPRAAVEFMDDGRAVIHALKSPDITSLIHELGHVFRRDVFTPEDNATAAGWAGAEKKPDGSYTWSREAEEKFARGFERYIADGSAPTKPLRAVFRKLAVWLKAVWSKIGGPNETLSDAMRRIYDRLFSMPEVVRDAIGKTTGDETNALQIQKSTASVPREGSPGRDQPEGREGVRPVNGLQQAPGAGGEAQAENPEGPETDTGLPVVDRDAGRRGGQTGEANPRGADEAGGKVEPQRQPTRSEYIAREIERQFGKLGPEDTGSLMRAIDHPEEARQIAAGVLKSHGVNPDAKDRGAEHVASAAQAIDDAVAQLDAIRENAPPVRQSTEPSEIERRADEARAHLRDTKQRIAQQTTSGIPVSPTEKRGPQFQRTTPAMGTAERDALEAEHKAYIEHGEKLYEQRQAAKDARDKARSGSNRHSALGDKISAIADRIIAHDEANKELHNRYRTAKLEDIAETGDEANALAALDEIEKKRGTYDKIKELARAEAGKQGVPEDDIEHLAMSAANTIHSYPGVRSLKDQVDIEYRHLKRNRSQAEAERVLNELDLPSQDDRRLRAEVKTAEHNPDRVKELLDEARKLAADMKARQEKIERDAAAHAKAQAVRRGKELQPLGDRKSTIVQAWDGSVLADGRYLSDGRAMIDTKALDAADAAKLRAKENGKTARRYTQKEAMPLWTQAVEDSKGRVEELGVRPAKGQPDQYYGRLPGGKHITLDANKLAYLKRVTGADEILGSTPKKPVVLRRDGKPVAVLMPTGMADIEPVSVGAPTARAVQTSRNLNEPESPGIMGESGHFDPEGLARGIGKLFGGKGDGIEKMPRVTEGPEPAPRGKARKAAYSVLDAISGRSAPKTTRADRQTGEALAAIPSAKIAAGPITENVARQVLGDHYGDTRFINKLGGLLAEDRLRGIRKGAQKRMVEAQDAMNKATDPVAFQKAEEDYRQAEKDASVVKTLVGADGSPFADEAAYRAAANDPEIKAALQRHREIAVPLLEQLHRAAGEYTEDEALPKHDLEFDAFQHLKAIREGEPMPGESAVRVGGPAKGSLSASLKFMSQFRRKAKGTGEAYDLNYINQLEHGIGNELRQAKLKQFYAQAEKSGVGIRGGSREAHIIDGEMGQGLDTKRRGLTRPEYMYFRPDIYREVRAAMETDMPPHAEVISNLLGGATMTALFGPSEAITHITNIGTALQNTPGSAGDALRKAAAAVGGLPNLATTAESVVRGIQDTLAKDPQFLSEMARIAEIGAGRKAPTPKAVGARRLDPVARVGDATGKLIHLVDSAARVQLSRAFDRLVEKGLADNTDTARREFINRIGQYNAALQPSWMRLLRGTAIGPFVTAGTSFLREGARRLILSSGVDTSSPQARIKLMAPMLSRVIGASAQVGLINYLLVGNPFGRKGTPLGAIDTSKDDENGNPKLIDAFNVFGYRRGMRSFGIDAVVAGREAKLPLGEIVEDMLGDAADAISRPFRGPGVEFGYTAATGRTMGYRSRQVAEKVPFGQSQRLANLKAAARELNPLGDILAGSNKKPEAWDVGKALAPSVFKTGRSAQSVDNARAAREHVKDEDYLKSVYDQAAQMPADDRRKFIDNAWTRVPPQMRRLQAKLETGLALKVGRRRAG